MDIKKGNRVILDVAIRDSDNVLVTDLSTAIDVKYMIKENATDEDNEALVSKSLGSGIAIDTPSTGYVRITINATDTSSVEVGEKFQALQIEYSSDNIIEVNLKDGNENINTVNILQDIIR